MNSSRWRNVARTAALLGLVLLIVGAATRAQDSSPLPDGAKAPQFRARSLNGRTVSLYALRGKVVMLDFWATWCGPCQMATPMLEKLYKQYGPQGLVIVGFSVDDAGSVGEVPQFVKHFGMTYPVVTAKDANASVQAKYNVTSFPSQFVIDKRGVVRWSQPGFSYDEDAALRVLIPKLLRGS